MFATVLFIQEIESSTISLTETILSQKITL